MKNKFLYEELEVLKKYNGLKEIPTYVKSNLASHISLREYQEEALKYFITYYETEDLRKNQSIHLLFHMATGSGKTVMMAAIILYLYSKGYRNFLFFVNQTNILEKTKENFLNELSSKYLYDKNLQYMGNKVKIKEVNTFADSVFDQDINICFVTTQKLHQDLTFPKENSLSYSDFENNDIVFISDESHHVNTLTKNANKAIKEEVNSWEYSVLNAFHKNNNNILLEFTATADLNDNNVKNKYLDKIIYNYPLFNFRQSGYTKDFQNFATNTAFWQRTLIALIMSEYRKYLFSDASLNVKPVVLLKSQRIKDSQDFYEEFFNSLRSLKKADIDNLFQSEIPILHEALNYFKAKDNSYYSLISSLQMSFARENSIIMNGATDNTVEKQLLVNSLEDRTNPIRIIFTVDMLNEGWDVLNLFDIVRLYDTRQGSGRTGKVGAYTIKEAQLIGRGARYFPFQMSDEQERSKRKYDYDTTNKNRILETMFYHSKNDSRYINELRQALIQTGMEDPEPIKRKYKVKQSFKDSDLYKKGFIFSNKKIEKSRMDIKGIDEKVRNIKHVYSDTSLEGSIVGLFDLNILLNKANQNKQTALIKFKEIEYHILSSAASAYKELNFNVLKSKYPNLKSTREFLTTSNYLGDNTLEINYLGEVLKGRVIYDALLKAFNNLVPKVINLQKEYEGSKEFYPYQIKEIIKDKTINLSSVDSAGGRGASQNNNPNEYYQLDLTEEDWYVFNDNYGTSEEKLAIKYFYNIIKPKLDKKNLKYYVIRNERIPELAIYSFLNGERFEPDFIIIIETDHLQLQTNSKYQVYLEPKGSHLLLVDQWKEKLLMEIENKSVINHNLLTANDNYTILGLPFYNSLERMSEFEKELNELLESL